LRGEDIPSAKHLNELALEYRDDKHKIKTWQELEPMYVRLSSPEEKASLR